MIATSYSYFIYSSFQLALSFGQLPPQVLDLSGQLQYMLVAVNESRCLPIAHY